MTRHILRRELEKKQEDRVDDASFNLSKYKKKGKWNIVGALDCLLQLARNSELCDEFWTLAAGPLRYLRRKLGLTDIQLIVVAILVDSGEVESWRSLANFLGISRLTMMTYSEEVEQLIYKGWLQRGAAQEKFSRSQGLRLCFGVVSALRVNKVFVPEKIDGLTTQQLVDRLEHFIDKNLGHGNMTPSDIIDWVDHLVDKNPGLELCKVLKKIEDKKEKLTFLMTIIDYSQYDDGEDAGLMYDSVVHAIDDEFGALLFLDDLQTGNLELFQDNLIEFKCEDGVVNNERYLLTSHTKNDVLIDYKPRRTKVSKSRGYGKFVMKNSDIKAKELFYNEDEGNQIARLTSLLEEEKFNGVQQRLEEEGMRKGFACIFHGAPGTGKTETVLQIARQTGRDIMQIDIAGMRDKWVGESERNIQGVFERYRNICKNCQLKPILFFNEADALFGKRMESAEGSADKMNNAMQNIILQEIEKLDGILIATTNLTGALDKAFERRFLFKVEFRKPTVDVKAKIWKSMFKGNLSDQDILRLASEYDFSGGEIENIARKRSIDYILEGEEIRMDKLRQYCNEERLAGLTRKSIGFSK